MTHTRHNPGHTLIELLVVMSVSLIVIGSIMFMTSSTLQGMDHLSSRGAVDHAATHAVGRISMELATAIQLNETEPTRIAFVVPDITGDGADDEVEYSWSGVAGEDIVRAVNGSAQPLVENVSNCSFAYIYTTTDTRDIQPEQSVETVTIAGFEAFPVEAYQKLYGPNPTFPMFSGYTLVCFFHATADAERANNIRLRAKSFFLGTSTHIYLYNAAGEYLAAGELYTSDLTSSVEWYDVPLAWQAPDTQGMRKGELYQLWMYEDSWATYGGSIEYQRIEEWEEGVSSWSNNQELWLSNGFGWTFYGDMSDLIFELQGTKRRVHGRFDDVALTQPKAVDVTIETAEGLYRAQQHVTVRLLNY